MMMYTCATCSYQERLREPRGVDDIQVRVHLAEKFFVWDGKWYHARCFHLMFPTPGQMIPATIMHNAASLPTEHIERDAQSAPMTTAMP